jgi:hypothetical protein
LKTFLKQHILETIKLAYAFASFEEIGKMIEFMRFFWLDFFDKICVVTKDNVGHLESKMDFIKRARRTVVRCHTNAIAKKCHECISSIFPDLETSLGRALKMSTVYERIAQHFKCETEKGEESAFVLSEMRDMLLAYVHSLLRLAPHLRYVAMRSTKDLAILKLIPTRNGVEIYKYPKKTMPNNPVYSTTTDDVEGGNTDSYHHLGYIYDACLNILKSSNASHSKLESDNVDGDRMFGDLKFENVVDTLSSNACALVNYFFNESYIASKFENKNLEYAKTCDFNRNNTKFGKKGPFVVFESYSMLKYLLDLLSDIEYFLSSAARDVELDGFIYDTYAIMKGVPITLYCFKKNEAKMQTIYTSPISVFNPRVKSPIDILTYTNDQIENRYIILKRYDINGVKKNQIEPTLDWSIVKSKNSLKNGENRNEERYDFARKYKLLKIFNAIMTRDAILHSSLKNMVKSHLFEHAKSRNSKRVASGLSTTDNESRTKRRDLVSNATFGRYLKSAIDYSDRFFFVVNICATKNLENNKYALSNREISCDCSDIVGLIFENKIKASDIMVHRIVSYLDSNIVDFYNVTTRNAFKKDTPPMALNKSNFKIPNSRPNAEPKMARFKLESDRRLLKYKFERSRDNHPKHPIDRYRQTPINRQTNTDFSPSYASARCYTIEETNEGRLKISIDDALETYDKTTFKKKTKGEYATFYYRITGDPNRYKNGVVYNIRMTLPFDAWRRLKIKDDCETNEFELRHAVSPHFTKYNISLALLQCHALFCDVFNNAICKSEDFQKITSCAKIRYYRFYPASMVDGSECFLNMDITNANERDIVSSMTLGGSSFLKKNVLKKLEHAFQNRVHFDDDSAFLTKKFKKNIKTMYDHPLSYVKKRMKYRKTIVDLHEQWRQRKENLNLVKRVTTPKKIGKKIAHDDEDDAYYSSNDESIELEDDDYVEFEEYDEQRDLLWYLMETKLSSTLNIKTFNDRTAVELQKEYETISNSAFEGCTETEYECIFSNRLFRHNSHDFKEMKTTPSHTPNVAYKLFDIRRFYDSSLTLNANKTNRNRKSNFKKKIASERCSVKIQSYATIQRPKMIVKKRKGYMGFVFLMQHRDSDCIKFGVDDVSLKTILNILNADISDASLSSEVVVEYLYTLHRFCEYLQKNAVLIHQDADGNSNKMIFDAPVMSKKSQSDFGVKLGSGIVMEENERVGNNGLFFDSFNGVGYSNPFSKSFFGLDDKIEIRKPTQPIDKHIYAPIETTSSQEYGIGSFIGSLFYAHQSTSDTTQANYNQRSSHKKDSANATRAGNAVDTSIMSNFKYYVHGDSDVEKYFSSDDICIKKLSYDNMHRLEATLVTLELPILDRTMISAIKPLPSGEIKRKIIFDDDMVSMFEYFRSMIVKNQVQN